MTVKERQKKFSTQYTLDPDELSFNKTVVPVRLARLDDKLISRSQAKRLVARFEGFKKVILDFEGVDDIGQAFADEVFRVFQQSHPDVQLVPHDASEDHTENDQTCSIIIIENHFLIRKRK